MKTNGPPEYELKMPFFIDTDGYTDRDREMFVCGVEWQMVYDQLQSGEPFRRTIHVENESRIRLMARRLGWQVWMSPSGVIGWSDMEAAP